MTLFDQLLRDRNSDLVKEALRRQCEVCHAEPGADCTNVDNLVALKTRVVHYVRVAP
jgi:hypothetical protein